VIVNSAPAFAQNNTPALIITHAPLPDRVKNKIYSSPQQVQAIKPQDIIGTSYRNLAGTTVGGEINQLQSDLNALNGNIESLADGLSAILREGDMLSAEYYADTATIQTQLRNGTTPGNPRLVSKLNSAQGSLQGLSNNLDNLNDYAVQIADAATKASYLLDSARSAYSLSGAVEEDHVALAQLEDRVNSTIVLIERLLNTANDSISRTTAQLSTERNNMRTLALAVANGDLYGRSLSNRPFAMAASYGGNVDDFSMAPADAPMDTMNADIQPTSVPAGGRPLAKIKFDRPDVNYEQPLYVAINEALERYPSARFDLVAVHPSQGNAAEVAIESTRARRNAERVLRDLIDMGIPSERIDMAYDQSDMASTSEVHLYIK
ncbi:MAG: hypothetical protein ACLFR0_06950, partial [Alphaproteobacteria bacterium]